MYAIRDKVYDKLTRFFSDSQTSNDVVDQEPEVCICVLCFKLILSDLMNNGFC